MSITTILAGEIMKRTTTAVWHEKHNRWQINVQKDGERRSFYSSSPGREGKRECRQKADAWLDEGMTNQNTRLSVLYDSFIANLENVAGEEHCIQYKGYGKNWIKPIIGNLRMADLSKQKLQTVINEAYKKKLSRKSLINIKGCITAFLKYARECKATNLFIEKLTIPNGAPRGERVILQPEDLITLFQCDNTVLYGKPTYELFINAYRFEVATGLRPGETIGLKSSDIIGTRINIKRSINRLKKETKGKNQNAVRSFLLTPIALEILERQAKKLAELNIESDYVFPNEYGEYIPPQRYYRRWVNYRNSAGIAEATPYELRHTFVSIVKQLPEGLLKPLVGHSKDMDTYGTYSHELTGDMEETADFVQKLFSQALKNEEKEKKIDEPEYYI